MRARFLLYGAALCLCLAPLLWGQDPVKVDAKHYKVVSENDQVRVLRIHYGPHEKSVMHNHPASVAVFLTDSKGQFTYPDGKKEPFTAKAGEARYGPAVTHLPENTSDKPFELVLTELKEGRGAPRAPKMAGKAKKK